MRLPGATVTAVVETAADLSWTVLGAGAPVTVFAHGLGGSSIETRPLAAKVPGTRVLLDFRGHGGSPDLVDGWCYAELAEDLLAVADAVGATRAVGLSLGAGALLRLLSQIPDRFERVAFVMPAALDRVSDGPGQSRLDRLGTAIDAAEVDAVLAILLEEVPPALRERSAVVRLLTRRAKALCLRPAPWPRWREDAPLAELADLGALRVPSLVVGQAGDRLHELQVARTLAGLLPCAQLLALGESGVFWNDAARMQLALAAHLTGADPLTDARDPRLTGRE